MPRKPRNSPNPPGRPPKERPKEYKPVRLEISVYAAVSDYREEVGAKTMGEAIAIAVASKKAP